MTSGQQIIAPLLPVALSVVVGIVAGYYGWIAPLPGFIAIGFALTIAFLTSRYAYAQTLSLLAATGIMGALLANRQVARLSPQWDDRNGQWELIISSEVQDRGKTFLMDAWTTDGKKVSCRLIKRYSEARPVIGEGLRVTGRMESCPTDKKAYYLSHGYSGRIFCGTSWRKQVVSTRGLSAIQRVRLRMLCWRHEVLGRLTQKVGDMEASALMAAMTLGDKTALSRQQYDLFSVTGASHVLALSGLHLGIIYMLLSVVMPRRPLRTLSQIVTILAIWAYALFVGLMPSVTRAATMISIYGLFSLGHRRNAGLNLLAFSAIVMLCAAPLSLYDVGFQMSYMAVAGILLMQPLLTTTGVLEFMSRNTILRIVFEMAAVSVAAQIAVAPLIAYYFHRFSTYFILSNFVVVPAAYVILVATLLLLATQWTFLAGMLHAVVSGMTLALEAIAHLPLASIDGFYPPILKVFLIYIVVGCTYVVITKLASSHATKGLSRI